MIRSEAIPILRSFESDSKKYLYGYAALFDSPDAFGTLCTREIVESSWEHLKKFPAVRFMHKEPLGQILFDESVSGMSTFVDDHGFHVLVQVYDERVEEWSMINSGQWGFSYGLMPASDGIKQKCLPNGKCYKAFVKGIFYEVSVVDTPAHSDAVAYVIQRFIHGNDGGVITNGEIEMNKKELTNRLGFRGMIDSAFPSKPEQSVSKPVIRGFGRGFSGMLDELSGGKKRSIAGVMPQAGVDECNLDCSFHKWCANFENQALCGGFELTENKKRILRNLGLGTVIRNFEINKEVRLPQHGFRAMLESACGETPATYTPVHRSVPLGFRGMLDDFTRGTEEEEAKQLQKVVPIFGFRRMLDDLSRKQERESEDAKAVIRSCGFKGMLEDAFTPKPTLISNPILRDLRQRLRDISNST